MSHGLRPDCGDWRPERRSARSSSSTAWPSTDGTGRCSLTASPTRSTPTTPGLAVRPRSGSNEFVENIRVHLSGFTTTQHISPNHLVAFDEQDPDRAICTSYMYAQHYLEGSPNGDFYLARGSYDNHMLRTAEGWRIQRIVQHVFWQEGNLTAVAESAARFAQA